jgi:hypothetical protein
LAAVERLWDELSLTYGHAFLGNWEGLDARLVKAEWGRKLAGLTPQQLEYGLGHIPPGRPPRDPLSFRALCLQLPDEADGVLALPPKRGPVHLPDPVREAFEKLRAPLPEPQRVRWAREYIERHGPQERWLGPVQKAALDAARKVVRFHEEDMAVVSAVQYQADATGATAGPE